MTTPKKKTPAKKKRTAPTVHVGVDPGSKDEAGATVVTVRNGGMVTAVAEAPTPQGLALDIRYPPSSMELREKCPGSGALASRVPRHEQSEAGIKGDQIHAAIQAAVAKSALELKTDPMDRGRAAAKERGLVEPYDQDTAGVGVSVLEAQVAKLLADEGFPDDFWPVIRTETGASLSAAGYHGRARIDFVVEFNRSLVMVVELKTGYIEVTGPSANRQLHDYLVGAVDMMTRRGPTPGLVVVGAILQPGLIPELWWRAGTWSAEQVHMLAQQLQGIRAAAWSPHAELVIGPHCGSCPAQEMCPARRGVVVQAVQEFEKHGKTVAEYLDQMEPADRAAAFDRMRQAKKYAEKFIELTKAWALNTKKPIPGWKIGAGRGERKFAKPANGTHIDTARKLFELVGDKLRQAKLAEQAEDLLEVPSPATIEKALGDVDASKVQHLVVKEGGAMALVEDKPPSMPKPRKPA